ncbi:MAG: glycine--tRNA ligase subunit beta [Candidatus Krumholzibacteriota bacterium]|nr:glycine--tRNA ligase subunit beta [Candidatus Krumholzibacteriota bacterium]
MKNDFLLEIGCENLPSGYIDGAVKQMEKSFSERMKSERIPFDSLYVTGTPNRLVLHARGLSVRQETAEEIITGPPLSAGIGPDGAYTKAAIGFAGRQGVGIDALSRVETGKGEYLAVVRKTESVETKIILSGSVPDMITGLRFPKMMKWDDSDLRFARPIRWIMSFFGSEPFSFRVAGLKSSVATRLSPYSMRPAAVEGIEDYFSVLKKNRIIIDSEKRKAMVASLAGKAAAETGGRLVEDDSLCEMVANLVESPVVLTGSFDSSFLDLPRKVIVTALKSHQRYFSVEGSGGELKSDFIAFADGARRNRKEIIKGYERVLQARLADARFYFLEDTAFPIEKMAGKLDRIVWLEGLGSLRDKAERIRELALYLLSSLPSDERPLKEDIERAAMLAKADLASEMVKDGKEFTLLQGYIGREYARVSKEREAVSEAIYEHYFPKFSGDRLPSTATGLVLSIADKLDTLCGCFIMGLEPSGSQDPYALRRSAMSILRMMIEKKLNTEIREGVIRSLALFSDKGQDDRPSADGRTEEKVMDFFSQRFVTILRGEGYDPDLVSAVLDSPWKVPFAVSSMTARLQEMRISGSLSDFVLAMKRITNILPKDMRKKVDRESGVMAMEAISGGDEEKLGFSRSLFAEKAEGLFFEKALQCAEKLSALKEPESQPRSFEILAELVPSINDYFDAVLVNCEDKAIKDNRISFLHALHTLFGNFCYYSAIAGD